MEKMLGVSSELGKNCGNIGFFSLGSAISFSCTKELYCLDVFSSVFPLMTTSRFVCFAYFLSPGMPLFSGTRHSAAIQFSLLTHIPESVLTTREWLPCVCPCVKMRATHVPKSTYTIENCIRDMGLF